MTIAHGAPYTHSRASVLPSVLFMNSIVLSALLPVTALIAFGFLLGRTRWLSPRVVKHLSDLAFLVLTPLLLFRTMGKVHVEQLDLKPAAAYILALALVFAGMLVLRGLSRTSAMLALAATYSNAVMIGIPLVTLAWGDAGLVTLLTLIPVHSLLLLTSATLALEFAVALEHRRAAPKGEIPQCVAPRYPHKQIAGIKVAGRMLGVAGRALRKALIHPVPLPIVAGLLFAQTGLVIPAWIDQPMRWLGAAFGPLALALVGITLAGSAIGAQVRGALVMTGIKNLLVPALAALLGWAMGMRGLSFAVMVVTAALPIGANVFMFSQRYGVAQQLVTASVAISTAFSAISVSLVLLLVARL